jgi:hypothetical protein
MFKIFQSAQQYYLESDKVIFLTVTASLGAVVGQVAIFLLKGSELPFTIPLFYSHPWGEAQLATSLQFLVLPLLSLLAILINSIILMHLHDVQTALKRILAISSLMVVILLLITAFGITTIFT